jgi:Ca2+-binding EF-hand superfamily protein
MYITQIQIRTKIVEYYNRIFPTKEKRLDYLIKPGQTDIEQEALENLVKQDIKDINAQDLKTFLATGADKETKKITKKRLKEILFDPFDMQNSEQQHLTHEEQLSMVFKGVTQKDPHAINRLELETGCKHIGLNLTNNEVDLLFQTFKKEGKDSLDLEDFTRLVEHKYSKDIMKSNIAAGRLEEHLEWADPYRTNQLKQNQIVFIFQRLNQTPTQQELGSLFAYLRQSNQGTVDRDDFFQAVIKGPTNFTREQKHLSGGLMKVVEFL